MSDVHVIESDEYREEEAAIAADPIAVGMAQTILDLSDDEMRSHGFMLAALREYQARGGQHSRSIGGVARALRRIIREQRGGA